MALHPLRGATPDQKGCTAYGSGALPPTTSTTADSSSRHTQAAASDAATPPRNTCPAPNKRRYTRSVALHPIRRATPDQKGCTAYGSGAHPITRTNAESARRSPTRRQHAGGQLLMLQTPTAQVKTVAHGRILTVLMESAPAGQVAVAGAVERPESDDGNHPSKSRTQFNAVIFRDGPQTLQFQRPHFNF